MKRKLLRPAVVWFGEGLDERVLNKAHSLLAACDLLLVVGTSSVVYPAAAFAPLVAEAGKPVIEINLEATENSSVCEMAIQGKAGEVLPTLLGVEEEVRAAIGVGLGGAGEKEEGGKKGKA
jgi:NAD-dependent deacetylase sirtuin 5